MGIFDKVRKSDKVEKTTDFMGGSFTVPSDIYDVQIKVAYMGSAASSKAQSVTLLMDVGGKEIRETVWITSKDGNNFYTKNDKDIELPGWTLIDELCLIASGVGLEEQEPEEKILKVYDPEQQAEVNKSVVTLSNLTGTTCSAAILEFKENKTKKDPRTNKYEPTEDVVVKNSIVKFFDTESHFTVVEAREEAESPVYWDTWLEKNKGIQADKTKKVTGNSGTAGGPPKANGTNNDGNSGAPRQALFGKRK